MVCHWLLNLFIISVFHFSGECVWGNPLCFCRFYSSSLCSILPCPFRWRHVFQSNRTLEIGFVGLNALCQSIPNDIARCVLCNNQIYDWGLYLCWKSGPVAVRQHGCTQYQTISNFVSSITRMNLHTLVLRVFVALWPRTIC